MQTIQRTLWMMALVAIYVGIGSPVLAQTVTESDSETPLYRDDTWHTSISPYLWLAGANGTIGFRGREVKIDQSFTDIFSNLKFGVMGLSEVRRGRISILTDLMYVRLGDEKGFPVQGFPNDVNVKASLNTFTLSPYLGYRIVGSRRGSIDFLTGGRYYHINSTIKFDVGGSAQPSSSTSDNWADFVEGARFSLNLSPRIGAFFMGDVGGGGSVLTWQLVGGVGYRWNKRWSTSLGYRRLYFNRQTNDGVGLEQTQQGLFVGATFRFR